MAMSVLSGPRARRAAHPAKVAGAMVVARAAAAHHAPAARQRAAAVARTGAAAVPSHQQAASAQRPVAAGPQAADSAPAGLSRQEGVVARVAIAGHSKAGGLSAAGRYSWRCALTLAKAGLLLSPAFVFLTLSETKISPQAFSH